MVRIMIADDHKIVRDGIKSLVKGAENIEVTGEASNGQELLDLLKNQQADLVILDLNMPIKDGFETMESLKELFPELKVLILSMLEHERYINKVIEAGASGYVLKNAGQEELLHAIKTVALGQQYLSPEISMNLLKKVQQSHEKNLSKDKGPGLISKRELEVLKLIAEGFTNAEIADKLFSSKRTIESHRKNLLEKTQVKNSAALIKYAIIHGIIE